MTQWQRLKNAKEYLSIEEFYRNEIVPYLSKLYVIKDYALQHDAIYLVVSTHSFYSPQILIVQYKIYGEDSGFRVLKEEDQPFNFTCPQNLLILSSNKSDAAKQWRNAHKKPAVRKAILQHIDECTEHIADDLKTIKKWRQALRYGMVITNSNLGVVRFDRVCPVLPQFLYVLDANNKEIYCHFNDFKKQEIIKAISHWESANFKSTLGF